ncbi:MAG: bifunctional nuclease family protein, partial [Muribaculaceae bacterium]|nr:bifunctional nuclease family protein [Muribaculaceae bacterium]
MENELVRLNIVGITYNQIENGMYAMVLEDENGARRLPIIIGYNEAQSIECLLQKIKTPRPLTHEFTSEILDSFGIDIESIVIKQLDNGIFTADVSLSRGDERHVLDARSSDAIALAMRADAPIYTSRSLLDRCGIEKESAGPGIQPVSSRQSIPARQAIERVKNPETRGYEDESEDSLRLMMEQAVKDEDYEKAGEIKLEIERRRAS